MPRTRPCVRRSFFHETGRAVRAWGENPYPCAARPPRASPVLACGPRLRASKRRGAARRSLQAGPAAMMAQSRSLHRTLITR